MGCCTQRATARLHKLNRTGCVCGGTAAEGQVPTPGGQGAGRGHEHKTWSQAGKQECSVSFQAILQRDLKRSFQKNKIFFFFLSLGGRMELEALCCT